MTVLLSHQLQLTLFSRTHLNKVPHKLLCVCSPKQKMRTGVVSWCQSGQHFQNVTVDSHQQETQDCVLIKQIKVTAQPRSSGSFSAAPASSLLQAEVSSVERRGQRSEGRLLVFPATSFSLPSFSASFLLSFFSACCWNPSWE